MKITIGSDHAGFALKKVLIEHLQKSAHQLTDVGTDSTAPVDYPDYALPVAEKVASGEFDRGILICGTGVGMSIAANKVKGIRCALVHDVFNTMALNASSRNGLGLLIVGE